MGIRRPHLTWRVPKPYAELYPAAGVALPVQAIAYHYSILLASYCEYSPLTTHSTISLLEYSLANSLLTNY